MYLFSEVSVIKEGDISNQANIVGVDYNLVMQAKPARSHLDNWLMKITKGRWAAFSPMDQPTKGAKQVLSSLHAAQGCSLYYVIFANTKKFKHLSQTAKLVLENHDIPVTHVDVLDSPDQLLDWIKENQVKKFFATWDVVPYAGIAGVGLTNWLYMM